MQPEEDSIRKINVSLKDLKRILAGLLETRKFLYWIAATEPKFRDSVDNHIGGVHVPGKFDNLIQRLELDIREIERELKEIYKDNEEIKRLIGS